MRVSMTAASRPGPAPPSAAARLSGAGKYRARSGAGAGAARHSELDFDLMCTGLVEQAGRRFGRQSEMSGEERRQVAARDLPRWPPQRLHVDLGRAGQGVRSQKAWAEAGQKETAQHRPKRMGLDLG